VGQIEQAAVFMQAIHNKEISKFIMTYWSKIKDETDDSLPLHIF